MKSRNLFYRSEFKAESLISNSTGQRPVDTMPFRKAALKGRKQWINNEATALSGLGYTLNILHRRALPHANACKGVALIGTGNNTDIHI
jgi:hypothetical protein